MQLQKALLVFGLPATLAMTTGVAFVLVGLAKKSARDERASWFDGQGVAEVEAKAGESWHVFAPKGNRVAEDRQQYRDELDATVTVDGNKVVPRADSIWSDTIDDESVMSIFNVDCPSDGKLRVQLTGTNIDTRTLVLALDPAWLIGPIGVGVALSFLTSFALFAAGAAVTKRA
ncbi:MAG: hypothetical protein AAGI17_07360 [Planctomycetota bacterium]